MQQGISGRQEMALYCAASFNKKLKEVERNVKGMKNLRIDSGHYWQLLLKGQ